MNNIDLAVWVMTISSVIDTIISLKEILA